MRRHAMRKQILACTEIFRLQGSNMLKDNEGHGFRNEENQFEFYEAMEAFLAQHLGGRSAA